MSAEPQGMSISQSSRVDVLGVAMGILGKKRDQKEGKKAKRPETERKIM